MHVRQTWRSVKIEARDEQDAARLVSAGCLLLHLCGSGCARRVREEGKGRQRGVDGTSLARPLMSARARRYSKLCGTIVDLQLQARAPIAAICGLFEVYVGSENCECSRESSERRIKTTTKRRH